MTRTKNVLFRLALVLAVSVTLVAACGQLGMTDDERLQRAQNYEQTGDLRSAGIELRQLLQQNPDHAEGRLALGVVSLELGDIATARAELARSRDLGVDPARLRIPMARLTLAEGDYARVLETLAADDELPESTDTQAELLLLRGEALAALGQFDQAIGAFERVLALNPDLALAHAGIASVQSARGDPQGARQSLERALDLNPKAHQAWHLLGDLERAEGRAVEAELAYGQAIEHARLPYLYHLKRALTRMSLQDIAGMQQDLAAMQRLGRNHPATAYVQGLVHFQNADYTDAQTSFQESLNRNPNFQPAVFFLGATHLAQQQWRQAERQLQDYLRAHPDSDDAARLLAQAQLGTGDVGRAEALLLSVLGRNPDDVLALNLIGNVYLARGEHQEGIGHLRRVAALQPSDPASRVSLAMGLLDAGEGSEGLIELRAALDEAEGSLEMEATYVLALIREGQYPEALNAADRLAERWPSSAVPYNLKAGAFIAMGDQAGAREALQDALRVEPGDPSASANLGQVLVHGGDRAAATRIYRESLQHNPGHPDISLRLAELVLADEGFEAARPVLEETIRLHPEQQAPRLMLARQHLERNEPRSALSVLEPIRQAAADNVQVLTLLARAQLGAGQRAQGVETLREASGRARDTADNRVIFGAAFEQAESIPDARAQYRRALQLEPAHAGALERLARLEAREGQTQEAMQLARQLQEDAGAAAIGYSIEGQLHARAGNQEDAARALLAAYERSPTGERAVAAAQALRQTGQEPEAAALLSERLQQNPDEDTVRFFLAEVQVGLGEHAEAARHYEDLIRVHPEHLLVLNNLAYVYESIGDPRALEFAERAYARAPDMPEVKGTLGWVLVNQGDVERGLPLLETASAALPDNTEVRYRYAFALARAGRVQEARTELTALLENGAPDFADRPKAAQLLEEIR